MVINKKPIIQLKINRIDRTELLRLYYLEINNVKYSSINVDEEKSLFENYKNTNSIKYKNKIINSQQRFVVSIAKQYTKNQALLMDLINEGNIGLMEAVENYNHNMGYRFITYAVYYIRRNIQDYISTNNSSVRQKNRKKTFGILERLQNRFYCENGREAETYELSEIFENKYDIKISSDYIKPIKVYELDYETTNESYSSDPILEFNDKFSSSNFYENKIKNEDIKSKLDRLLGILSPRDRCIVEKTYGIGCDKQHRDTIAEEFNLTVERVRQICERSIVKLRKKSNCFNIL